MIYQIQKWLNNPKKSYKDGLAIYHKLKIDTKHDKFLNEVIEPAQNDMRFKMLISKLNDCAAKLRRNPELQKKHAHVTVETAAINNDIIVLKTPKKIIERPVVDENPHINREELPEELKAKYDRNKIIAKEMGELHFAMKALPKGTENNAGRQAYAEQITALENEKRANWNVIDLWWNTRRNEPPKVPAVNKELTPAQTAKKINAAKNYLRRFSEKTDAESVNKCREYQAFLKSVGINWTPKKKPEPQNNGNQKKGNKKK